MNRISLAALALLLFTGQSAQAEEGTVRIVFVGEPSRAALGSDRGLPWPAQPVYVDSEKMYPITTNQADSEVLLVENGVVYYRVSDCLYSAEIRGGEIGAPKLLAKAEEVRDAHWAFIIH